MCEPGPDVSMVADILVAGPLITLRVSHLFMAQTALEPHLMLASDNFLD